MDQYRPGTRAKYFPDEMDRFHLTDLDAANHDIIAGYGRIHSEFGDGISRQMMSWLAASRSVRWIDHITSGKLFSARAGRY